MYLVSSKPPNTVRNSLKLLTRVGLNAGPDEVRPIRAAPIVPAPAGTNVSSISCV